MWPIGRRVGNWNMVLIYWKQIVGPFLIKLSYAVQSKIIATLFMGIDI